MDKIEYYKDFYDNVHGFIRVTELESEIIDSPFFQRLRNISQLGLLNYVFPGALHNRFNHSLGVLHMADKMTVSLQEKGCLENKREIIRMAALLHDIGHYPLSHLVEKVVKDDAKSKFPTTDIFIEEDSSGELGIGCIDHEIHKLNLKIHDTGNPSDNFAHHERISNIVIYKTEIHDILLKNFTEDEIKIITQIISGIYPGPERYIIHSELDADRFDYLMRDSRQTGVLYGLIDIDQIIRNLELYEPEDNRIVVNEKGRKAIEHYLMGKYFLYSSVLYHKTMVGFDLMAKVVYKGLMEREKVWSYLDIIDCFKSEEASLKFLDFNDAWFFNKLKEVRDGKITFEENEKYEVNDEILKDFVNRILIRKPLKLFHESEQLIKKDVVNFNRLFEPAVKEKIVELANIEDYWYIPFEVNIKITEISPHTSLSEESPSRGKDETIMIKYNNVSHEKEIGYLLEDDTSVIKELGDVELNIKRIYTKDQDYKNKLNEALVEYDSN
ncbi:MAG: HD domain-containing protein [Spirochaetes bacterium]|nr:HD domain-containing protein [Spirochaetota bacterium]